MKKKKLTSLKLTIIIPVYNEEDTINILLDKIEKQNYIKKQIIIVDDKSEDNSLNIIKKFKFKSEFKIIKHKKNSGKGSCIISAQKFINGNFVIIQDADLEYDPNDYYKMISLVIKKEIICLYGSRVLGSYRYSKKNFTSILRIFFNHMLTLLTNILYSQSLTDAHTCYKLVESNLFKKIKLEQKKFSFCPELTAKISKLNIKIYECKIKYKGRTYEQGKKINFLDGFEAIWVLLKYKLNV